MSDERYAFLALSLLGPYKDTNPRGTEPMFGVADEIAKGILANPQAHIDALVEAGVLARRTGADIGYRTVYEVVASHVHEWKVVGFTETPPLDKWVLIGCTGCHITTSAPNKFPMDGPE